MLWGSYSPETISVRVSRAAGSPRTLGWFPQRYVTCVPQDLDDDDDDGDDGDDDDDDGSVDGDGGGDGGNGGGDDDG